MSLRIKATLAEKGYLGRLGWTCTHTAHLKQITNKDPLYSTGTSAQCYVAVWIIEQLKGEWIHTHIYMYG